MLVVKPVDGRVVADPHDAASALSLLLPLRAEDQGLVDEDWLLVRLQHQQVGGLQALVDVSVRDALVRVPKTLPIEVLLLLLAVRMVLVLLELQSVQHVPGSLLAVDQNSLLLLLLLLSQLLSLVLLLSAKLLKLARVGE